MAIRVEAHLLIEGCQEGSKKGKKNKKGKSPFLLFLPFLPFLLPPPLHLRNMKLSNKFLFDFAFGLISLCLASRAAALLARRRAITADQVDV